jgi:hypothetical protein
MVSGDRAQHVVEVVGDAAGQLADGIELLRLPELLFEPVALGDIGQRISHRPYLPILMDGGGIETHLDHGAVLAPPFDPYIAQHFALEHALEQPVELRLGAHRHQRIRPADHFLCRIAEDLLRRPAPD